MRLCVWSSVAAAPRADRPAAPRHPPLLPLHATDGRRIVALLAHLAGRASRPPSLPPSLSLSLLSFPLVASLRLLPSRSAVCGRVAVCWTGLPRLSCERKRSPKRLGTTTQPLRERGRRAAVPACSEAKRSAAMSHAHDILARAHTRTRVLAHVMHVSSSAPGFGGEFGSSLLCDRSDGRPARAPAIVICHAVHNECSYPDADANRHDERTTGEQRQAWRVSGGSSRSWLASPSSTAAAAGVALVCLLLHLLVRVERCSSGFVSWSQPVSGSGSGHGVATNEAQERSEPVGPLGGSESCRLVLSPRLQRPRSVQLWCCSIGPASCRSLTPAHF